MISSIDFLKFSATFNILHCTNYYSKVLDSVTISKSELAEARDLFEEEELAGGAEGTLDEGCRPLIDR